MKWSYSVVAFVHLERQRQDSLSLLCNSQLWFENCGTCLNIATSAIQTDIRISKLLFKFFIQALSYHIRMIGTPMPKARETFSNATWTLTPGKVARVLVEYKIPWLGYRLHCQPLQSFLTSFNSPCQTKHVRRSPRQRMRFPSSTVSPAHLYRRWPLCRTQPAHNSFRTTTCSHPTL